MTTEHGPARRVLRVGDIDMTVAEAGPQDGPAVLLVHGLGWDALRLWHGTLGALGAAGFRAVAPDLRGVGGTEATDSAYSTALYAADLAALLDRLEIESAALVGFSMGASVAVATAARWGGATALVLACGGLHATPEGAAATEAMLARAATLGPRAFAEEQAAAIFHPPWARANPEAVADFIGWRSEMDQDALWRAFRSGYGGDWRATAQGLGLPTQVIAAADDSFCAVPDMRAMAAAIPGARFDLIEDCGHMAPVERPEVFEPLLAGFLAARAAAA